MIPFTRISRRSKTKVQNISTIIFKNNAEDNDNEGDDSTDYDIIE